MTPRALIAGVMLTCALPAQATPPDFIRIQDELLAISAESLFLLRATSDNLGLHEGDTRTLALIELDRETGAETVWPGYSAAQFRDYEDDPRQGKAMIEAREIAGAANPFARLTEADALPLALWSPDTVLAEMDPDGGNRLILGQPDGPPLIADLDAMKARANAAITAYGQRMDYQRMGPLSFAQILQDAPLDGKECHLGHTQRIDPLRARGPADPPAPVVMRLDCSEDDGESVVAASLLMLVLPDVP
ncbi:MAG: hypothetical protein Q4G26_05595 [Paracoccus sp. (in: a-proteobacteria)]|nr:hypothetical protein [Paracoccus sp. (in: a-proteobacteria)]